MRSMRELHLRPLCVYQAITTKTIVACISCKVLDEMHVVELD
jgi:hypothetical protein